MDPTLEKEEEEEPNVAYIWHFMLLSDQPNHS
jgi:hypothetical protein